MTWDGGPCLPAPEPVEPMTDEKLRALLARLDELAPARPVKARKCSDPTDRTDTADELAARRRHRARQE